MTTSIINIEKAPKYSFVIPSRGDRPRALAHALDSINTAMEAAGLSPSQIEARVGFDGVKGERVRDYSFVRYYDFPKDNDFGNAIRHGLLKATKGERLIFHDDDNALLPEALTIYEKFPNADMIIARIDVSRAFEKAYLPEIIEGRPIVRQCNIDPLCLCLSRELVVNDCGGWLGNRYEADFVNIVRYYRRAKNIEITNELVGIYDAGRGMDEGGLNFRQKPLEEAKN